jgi:hypothetical protein
MGEPNNRLLVFLDIDGVMRVEDGPRERLDTDCRECFERTLRAIPDARVVISSTWRLVYGIGALRGFFSPDIGLRILGVTPVAHAAKPFPRHPEIRGYLRERQALDRPWVAIDDNPGLFPPDAPLIATPTSRGFDEEAANKLLSWNARVATHM